MPENNQVFPVKVAVYGTLKAHGSNHGLIKESKFLGTGETDGIFNMLSMGSYPCAVSGTNKLEVEVYEVSADTLQQLDWLEGHPSFYRREPVIIRMDTDAQDPYVEALMYTLRHIGSYNQYAYPPITNTTDTGALSWLV